MNKIKQYGFKLNEIEDPKAYRLGGVQLPKEVLNPTGQWDDFLPPPELQHNSQYDTSGCTVYGTENVLQMLEKFHFGQDNEYAERYNYNIVGINPPGADPHDAAESFRKHGAIDYDLLPRTETIEEYRTPRPMSKKYFDIGNEYPYELRHEWLWTRSLSKENRTLLVKEYLKYSPLGVSVTAWWEEKGVYVDRGQKNTHWAVLYGWTDRGWKIKDSYYPHLKILSFDHNIEVCKRFQLVKKDPRIPLIWRIINKIGELLGLIETIEEQPRESEKIPESKNPSIYDFALAIQKFEGWYPPGPRFPNGSLTWRTKNPGALRFANQIGNIGQFQGFAVFPDYETGLRALIRQIEIARDGSSRIYKPWMSLSEFFRLYAPSSDNNNPDKYALFVADELKVDVDFKIGDLS